jgi:hypothetical protein
MVTRGPDIESVKVESVVVYKGEEVEPTVTISPEDTRIKEVSISVDDTKIAEVTDDNKIKGVEEGNTTLVYTVTDSNKNKKEIKNVSVTVKLTEEQEKEKKAEEEKKAKEEAEKKAAALKKSRNTLSITEKWTIKKYCKEVINSALKSPSTAEYPGSLLNPYKDWDMTKKNNVVTIKSYVDAQNSYGVPIRSYFTVKVKMTDDGSGTVKYVKLNGKVLMNK